MVRQKIAPLRVFIIERQTLIAKALHSFLSKHALVRVVGDASALRVDELQRARPDLIIYSLDDAADDIGEVLSVARGVLPGVRLCVLSSFANTQVMQRSIDSGADAFVVKDATPRELDAALLALAAGSSYIDPRLAPGTPAGRRSARPDLELGQLTAREVQILKLLAGAYSNKEISLKLKLTEKTIKNYNNRIFSKLNVTSRTQAAVYAIKAGLGTLN